MMTSTARPSTTILPSLLDATVTTSEPLAAVTVTVSILVSAALPPSVAARSMATSVVLVPAEIADDDGVRTVQRPDVDALDVGVEVGAPRRSDFRQRPVGRDANRVADLRSDQAQGIELGAALDDVAAVAVAPDEQVVAGAQQGDVVARAAGDRVIAIVAGQIVVTGATVDDIVASPPTSSSAPARR